MTTHADGRKRKPNLIFFIPDQWRGDVLGHVGNAAAVTPHLDRLVETDAVSFTHAFCQNPICTPSRCSFMTGWYPHVRGHRTISHPLRADEQCLLSELRKAGYYVWWGGKNDLVSDPIAYESCQDYRNRTDGVPHRDLHSDLGWRHTIDGRKDTSFLAGRLEKLPGEKIYRDADWANVLAAREFLKERAAGQEQPFCLFLPLVFPHPPYGVEEPYFSQIDRTRLPARIRGDETCGKSRMNLGLREALGLEGRPELWWDELRATYYGMCSRVDAQAGLILDALKETGLFDEAAFFFFSDHGDFTGDYGLVEKAQNLFDDCLTRVPFILKPPASCGHVNGLRSGLVELVDFPATVYELAGLRPDYTHFGKSLLHMLPRDGEHREVVFCSGGRLKTEEHCMEAGASHPDSLYAPRLGVQISDDVAHGKAVMCRDRRFKLVSRLYEPDELYDFATDPGERHNVVDNPIFAPDRARLEHKIRRHLMETADVVPWKRYPRDY